MKKRYIIFIAIIFLNLSGILSGDFWQLLFLLDGAYALYLIAQVEKQKQSSLGLTSGELLRATMTKSVKSFELNSGTSKKRWLNFKSLTKITI